MKKAFSAVCAIIMLVTLFGCSAKDKMPVSNSLGRIAQNYSSEKIEKYDSPYTAAFKNNNGSYDLYIFASPVQYKDDDKYIQIDNRLEQSSEENYPYQVKSNKMKLLFPKSLSVPFSMERDGTKLLFELENSSDFKNAKQCTLKNLYGDKVDAVKYESENADLYFYSTNLGLRIEFNLKNEQAKKSYTFKVTDNNRENFVAVQNDGYASFYEKANMIGLFYSSLSKAEKSNSFVANKTVVDDHGDEGYAKIEYTVGETFSQENKSIKSDASIEFYDNKMPDSTAYSKFAQYPYLSNYYELWSEEKGEANHFMRMRLNYFVTTQSENILSASYYVKVLNKIGGEDADKIKMHQVNSQWSSTKLTWQTKGEVGDEIARLKKDGKDTYFDVTKFVKECVDDAYWIKESYGAVISSDGKSNNSFLVASDNSLYPPYIKVVFEKEPAFFEPQENINNVEF